VAFRANGAGTNNFVPAASGPNPVPFANEDYDLQDGAPANNYDNANYWFTAPVAGVYEFSAQISGGMFGGTGTANIVLSLVPLDGGSTAITVNETVTGAEIETIPVAGGFLLAAGQRVRVEIQNTASGQPDFVIPATGSPAVRTFSGFLVMAL
jgi:hypothetical protein